MKKKRTHLNLRIYYRLARATNQEETQGKIILGGPFSFVCCLLYRSKLNTQA